MMLDGLRYRKVEGLGRYLHVPLESRKIDASHLELDFTAYAYAKETDGRYRLNNGAKDYYSDNLGQTVEIEGKVFAITTDGAEIKLSEKNHPLVSWKERGRMMRVGDRYYTIQEFEDGTLLFNDGQNAYASDKDTGKVTYYHMVLEAKLVTENGLALSIDTEFIENPDANTTKQDCELKAFYRLAPRLKKAFSSLPICLLMDGLYANQAVMSICAQYRWKYIISFKEGSMPVKYEEFVSLCGSVQSENKVLWVLPDKTRQEFEFATDIEHEGYTFNVIRCVETKPTEKTSKQYVWMTNLSVTKSTCMPIANQGGRLRWNIENQGFNAQKNGGYHLEHAYSHNSNSDKCFYILLQIAHTINQLIEKGSLLSKETRKKIGSIKNIAWLLLENIRTSPISKTAFEALFTSGFQIRLDSA